MALALEESTQRHVFCVWLESTTQIQVQLIRLCAQIVTLVRMALAQGQSSR